MTRINLVPPSELMDQHLFAEFREIKMVSKALRRSLEAARKKSANPLSHLLSRIPKEFTLNTGHVSFFYNKGAYLNKRYEALKEELCKRNINFDREAVLDDACVFQSLPVQFNCDYVPTQEALKLIRERIALRISEKPGWYRYCGKITQEK